MAKLNTTEQNAAFWLAQAERYDREASKHFIAAVQAYWVDKANAARAKAAEVAQQQPA